MPFYLGVALDLGLACLVGGLIGMEREFRGRPAGLRTHVLVAIASTLLMLATVHQNVWLQAFDLGADTVRTDPTRMAQGIMTGIGFLGGGVIFKAGLSIHGLTTAASIWVTSAIGILIGIGFYIPAVLGALITIITLSLFQALERLLPTQQYARLSVRFDRDAPIDETALREMLDRHRVTLASLSHRLLDGGAHYEYYGVIHALRRERHSELAAHLRQWDAVLAFELVPSSD